MTNSATTLRPSSTASLAAALAVSTAERCPDTFVEFCFADPLGKWLTQSAVHKELQAFLTARRHGLVELPRDHGKSTQVCARLVWELGHNPGLRIQVVCA